MKPKQGTKSELKCFSFKHVKNFPTELGRLVELESHETHSFVILHFMVYIDSCW